MKRTPEEERIFRALAQIETPEADLSAALRRAEEPPPPGDGRAGSGPSVPWRRRLCCAPC